MIYVDSLMWHVMPVVYWNAQAQWVGDRMEAIDIVGGKWLERPGPAPLKYLHGILRNLRAEGVH